MFFHGFNSLTKLGAHKHPIDKVAEVNGILSGIALYPQLFKAILSKSVEGLSLYTFIFIFVSSAVWIWYARHRSLPQVMISSSLNLAAAGLLVFLILYYASIKDISLLM